MYFIDKLALRAGNEKDSDETADTVGCCSLRVEHISEWATCLWLCTMWQHLGSSPTWSRLSIYVLHQRRSSHVENSITLHRTFPQVVSHIAV